MVIEAPTDIQDENRDALEKAKFRRNPDDDSSQVATIVENTKGDPIPIANYDIQTDSFSAIAASGTFEVGELIRLIGGNFESGALPTITWSTALVGTGTATVITGELVFSTGTTANSEATVQSVNRAEFVTATFNKAHLAFANDDFSATDVIYEWGMYDPVNNILSGDGVFFRNTSGSIQVVRRKAGVDIEIVDEVDFNGETLTGLTQPFVSNNNVHIYEITYNAGRIDFLQDRKLMHRMTSLDAVAYETVHLTLGASLRNINGNTTENSMRTRGFSCSRIGTSSAQPDSITLNAPGSDTLKNSPGSLQSLIITNPGAGGANIILFDSATPGTGAFATVDLTESLVELNFNRRLNNGLSYTVAGNNFEVLLNWR